MTIKINDTISKMINEMAAYYQQSPDWVVEDMLRDFYLVWIRGRLSGLAAMEHKLEGENANARS